MVRKMIFAKYQSMVMAKTSVEVVAAVEVQNERKVFYYLVNKTFWCFTLLLQSVLFSR